MSSDVNGIIAWLRQWFDDVYAPKGSGGSDLDIDLVPKSENDDGVICFSGGLTYDLDKVYPVGSIYMSVNSANPSTLFGGTWQKIEGRFLLASGTTSGEDPNPNNTYILGDTDGEATHTLTIGEMPSHNHSTILNLRFLKNSATASESGHVTSWSNHWETQMSNGSVNKGGGQAHNNMPPYLVVNVWERTA